MVVLLCAVLTLHSQQVAAAVAVASRVTMWNDGSSVPTDVPSDLTNIVAVAAGSTHCLLLRSDGTVAGLGDNSYGQTNILAGLTNVIAIAAGSFNSMVLKNDGTVAAWGSNAYGQTQVPSNLTQVVAIAALDNISLALRADHTLAYWGSPFVVPGLSNYLVHVKWTNGVALAGRGSIFYLLNADHSVSSQSTVAADFTNIVAIAVGQLHNLALRDNGLVVSWPVSSYNKVPTNLNNVVAISAGRDRSLALLRDGSITNWGRNLTPQTNAMPPLADVIAVASGIGFSVTLSSEQPGPVVFMPPLGFQDYQGGTAFLAVGACGRPPLRYQWQRNGEDIPGATNAWLSVTLDPQTIGEYAVQVTNDFGAVTSSSATLDLKPFDPPYLYCQPSFQTTHLGGPATFKVGVSSRAPLQFQWRRNAIPLSDNDRIQGSRSPILLFSRTENDDCGRYSVVAESQAGSVTSQEANLSFVPIAQWGFDRHPLEIAPLGLTNVVGIAAGGAHNMALTADGRVIAWGANYANQLDVPATLTNVVSIAAGDSFSLALRSDGKVILWGRDPMSYTLGTKTLTINSAAVTMNADSQHCLLLGTNGYLLTYGNDHGAGNPPAGLTNITALSCGEEHNLVLTKDGRPVAWGSNSKGQTDVPPDLTNVVAIASGRSHNLALRSDGTVAAWGANDRGQAAVPAGLTNVMAVECGDFHSLAVTRDGSVVAWGFNAFGQTEVPPGLSKVVTLAGGYYQSLALREDGTVVVWGNRISTCVPENLTNAVALANGGQHRLALDSNGTVYGWGRNDWGEIDIPTGLSGIKSIAADYSISLAVRSNGTVVAWGATNNLMNPPPELTNVAAIASCVDHAIALKSDGLISVWGYLQPGLSQVPPNLTNAIAVATGVDFFMALTSQGSVVVWGNDLYITNFPSELTNITAIAAGYDHALALESDGTVVAWGSNLYGQTNVPPGLTNVIAIAASQIYNLALKKNGTLVAWGLINQLPEVQIPVLSSRATTIATGLGWGLALLAAPPSVLRLETLSSNLAGGIFRLKLMGEFGQSIVVEASTNLSQWDRIAILTNTNGTFFHDDAAAGQFPQRFYRARSPNADEGSIP